MRAWHHLYPALPPFQGAEQLRAGIGALIGISLCAVVVNLGSALGGPSLFLVAPLGATAVLVFCVPNSPLAQPWSAVVGNMVSALVALVAVTLVPSPWTVGVAVGGAIAAMMLVRALHPPGGAVALLTALDPDPAMEAGTLFALMPVGVTTVTLVIAAIAYNRATGRVYPFRQPRDEPAEDAAPRLGLSNDQLGNLLERFNQSTNMGVADLGRLLAAAEAEAAQHRFDGTTCADIMTTGLITAQPDTTLAEAARLFRNHAIKSLPVVDGDMTLRGIVLQADLLTPMAPRGGVGARTKARGQTVSDVMRTSDRAVQHDLAVGALLNRLAVQGSEVIPVERGGRLVGILTRSDIIRLLLSGAEERPAA
ncbi:CBS domain-containing membrane protein [Tranquillimonas rosea]|uniref:CBS domain-containing membrane protein n=1 Tax=Tranquillimonas rosea TaxID=641238 RepID=A0A1H9XAE6_9RHOB|nr:HPP family protein [Tranquillimonas rosea]SES42613.1 CBS domain-containing membrane protein [Tranquillimonas rosea]